MTSTVLPHQSMPNKDVFKKASLIPINESKESMRVYLEASVSILLKDTKTEESEIILIGF